MTINGKATYTKNIRGQREVSFYVVNNEDRAGSYNHLLIELFEYSRANRMMAVIWRSNSKQPVAIIPSLGHAFFSICCGWIGRGNSYNRFYLVKSTWRALRSNKEEH